MPLAADRRDRRRRRRMGFAATLSSAPAKARVWVSVNVGVPAPWGWGYYAPPPAYYYPYGPVYYGYPYAYPYYRHPWGRAHFYWRHPHPAHHGPHWRLLIRALARSHRTGARSALRVGHLAPASPVEQTARGPASDADHSLAEPVLRGGHEFAPLLEEKRDAGLDALIAQQTQPIEPAPAAPWRRSRRRRRPSRAAVMPGLRPASSDRGRQAGYASREAHRNDPRRAASCPAGAGRAAARSTPRAAPPVFRADREPGSIRSWSSTETPSHKFGSGHGLIPIGSPPAATYSTLARPACQRRSARARRAGAVRASGCGHYGKWRRRRLAAHPRRQLLDLLHNPLRRPRIGIIGTHPLRPLGQHQEPVPIERRS